MTSGTPTTNDPSFEQLTKAWFEESIRQNYSYGFTWLGRPIIQYPQDIVALQEIIWATRPDLIIETGIAHGGSLIFSASMLELMGGNGHVLGIDIDIRAHNKVAIEQHPMFKRITMIEGSSVDPTIVNKVHQTASQYESIMVVLDSNHTHDHVFRELAAYSPLVTKGNYLIVFDTVIEHLPPDLLNPERSWSQGDNAKTAVIEFLKNNSKFTNDHALEQKLQITVAPGGYLKCIS